MAQHDLAFKQIPRVVYTYPAEDGERHALVIDRGLDDFPYWYSADAAVFSAATPLTVRTMLMNQHISQHVRNGLKQYVVAVKPYKTQSGERFFEFQLTQAGHDFVMDVLRGTYQKSKKVTYDRSHTAAKNLFASFSPELQAALTTLNLRPL